MRVSSALLLVCSSFNGAVPKSDSWEGTKIGLIMFDLSQILFYAIGQMLNVIKGPKLNKYYLVTLITIDSKIVQDKSVLKAFR